MPHFSVSFFLKRQFILDLSFGQKGRFWPNDVTDFCVSRKQKRFCKLINTRLKFILIFYSSKFAQQSVASFSSKLQKSLILTNFVLTEQENTKTNSLSLSTEKVLRLKISIKVQNQFAVFELFGKLCFVAIRNFWQKLDQNKGL